jgi:hypothetical protein
MPIINFKIGGYKNGVSNGTHNQRNNNRHSQEKISAALDTAGICLEC